jgi:hypothetical protein
MQATAERYRHLLPFYIDINVKTSYIIGQQAGKVFIDTRESSKLE